MIYNVTKQYTGASEQPCKRFDKLASAKAFATESAESDAAMRINVVYRIYEFDEVIDTIDSRKITPARASSESTGGKGQGASFRPTPLETSPRPKGTAPKWMHDEEEDNKDKE